MEPIELHHAKNFRDLAGAKTNDGRVVKEKMLLRGRSLFGVKLINILILKNDYNLKTIIDLRTKRERTEKPNVVIPGVEVLNMPIFDEAKVGLSHEKRTHSFFTLRAMPPMEELYESMVKDESLENLVEILKTILLLPQEKFSVLFHCSVGKDRTGIVAALLLLFLGVKREDVFADYLYTDKFNRLKGKLARVGLLIVKHDNAFSKKIANYYRAEESFLQSSLSILENDFGTIENFFKQKLNFSEQQTEEIKNKFLTTL